MVGQLVTTTVFRSGVEYSKASHLRGYLNMKIFMLIHWYPSPLIYISHFILINKQDFVPIVDVHAKELLHIGEQPIAPLSLYRSYVACRLPSSVQARSKRTCFINPIYVPSAVIC